MKKFIVSLIILIIVGATVFGFGYAPIRLQPGERVLMFSRTSGWDDEPLYPGSFAWKWELLIPRNVTFYRFPAETRRVSISSSASLPSAELYQEYLEGTPPLEERIRLRLRYRISDSGLAQLAPMGLDPDGVSAWYDDFDDRLRTVALDATGNALRTILDQPQTESFTVVISQSIEERIGERFPEIDLEAVIVEEATIPDVALYQMARGTYEDVQATRRATMLSVTTEAATRQTIQNERLDTLARYGEILDRHPVLLDYLEIAAQHGEDPLSLDQLQSAVTQ